MEKEEEYSLGSIPLEGDKDSKGCFKNRKWLWRILGFVIVTAGVVGGVGATIGGGTGSPAGEVAWDRQEWAYNTDISLVAARLWNASMALDIPTDDLGTLTPSNLDYLNVTTRRGGARPSKNAHLEVRMPSQDHGKQNLHLMVFQFPQRFKYTQDWTLRTHHGSRAYHVAGNQKLL